MKIACDLFEPLRLYSSPDWLLASISQHFPEVAIVPANTGKAPSVCEDAQIYWGNRITLEIIEAMPRLEWIHFGSVGIDRADNELVRRRGIIVTNSSGLMVAPMVASALAFMSNLARGLHRSETLRRKGCMDRAHFDQYFDDIQDLVGQKCLIVGFGAVGRALARVCTALDMTVSVVQRQTTTLALPPGISKGYELAELGNAVMDADYVVNLLPLNLVTRMAFSAEVFSSMKPSAYFINIGRGQTVDEAALVKALQTQKLAGAGLDVFETEPLAMTSPLYTMENVLLTPHVAGLSQQYWSQQADLFQSNLGFYLQKDFGAMKNRCISPENSGS
jgi:phosphoglycerate dehydrogenase-like enzyme